MSDIGTTRHHVRNLERFVSENDDLFKLESMIGRFNVFEALSVERRELSHSNFLAWLLDPSASHGQGDLFLHAVLVDMLKQQGGGEHGSTISLLDLDGADLHDSIIRREDGSLDLLIECPAIDLVIAAENKVDSDEHSDQLNRYRAIVTRRFPTRRKQFIYLTPDGDDPDNGEGWMPYSYSDIHSALTRARQRASGSIGVEVGVFLDHYLDLIGRHMMDNTELRDLCKRIYRNHKSAIDMIMEHAGGDAAPLLEAFKSEIENRFPNIQTWDPTAKEVRLLPPGWKDAQPLIGLPENDRIWLVVRLLVKRNQCWLGVRTLLVENQAERNRILDALFEPTNGLGFRPSFSTWRTQKRVLLTTDSIEKWKDGSEPDVEAIAKKAVAQLDALMNRLRGLPDVVQRARMAE